MVSLVVWISPVIVHFGSLHLIVKGEEGVLEWEGLAEGHGQVGWKKGCDG